MKRRRNRRVVVGEVVEIVGMRLSVGWRREGWRGGATSLVRYKYLAGWCW